MPGAWGGRRPLSGFGSQMAEVKQATCSAGSGVIRMRVHQLKSWSGYFEAMFRGEKPFEVRKADREFRAGDFLMLMEWAEKPPSFLGRSLVRRVLEVWYHVPGIEQNFVVLEVGRTTKDEEDRVRRFSLIEAEGVEIREVVEPNVDLVEQAPVMKVAPKAKTDLARAAYDALDAYRVPRETLREAFYRLEVDLRLDLEGAPLETEEELQAVFENEKKRRAGDAVEMALNEALNLSDRTSFSLAVQALSRAIRGIRQERVIE